MAAHSLSPHRPPVENDTDRSVRLVLALGHALHTYGTPAQQLEEALLEATRRLGLTGQFFSTPTSLFVAIGRAPKQQTFLLRVEPGEVNVEKLAQLGEVLARMSAGTLGPEAAERRIRTITAQPRRYGPVTSVLAFPLVSTVAAYFLGGGPAEWAAACVIGLLVGIFAEIAGRHRRLARLFEMIAGVTAMSCAVAAAHWLAPISLHTAAVAGLITLIPGLTLTVAVTELATRHLASGTARLMGALVILFALGFGVALGLRLALVLPPMTGTPPMFDLPAWMLPVPLAVGALALTILFRGRPVDYLPILFATAIGFIVTRAGTSWAGPELGASLGAFAVAAGSNLHARVRRIPALTTVLPGLLMIVPGSLGYRGIAALLDTDVTVGVTAGFSMLMIAMGIAAGLFFANIVIPARQLL